MAERTLEGGRARRCPTKWTPSGVFACSHVPGWRSC